MSKTDFKLLLIMPNDANKELVSKYKTVFNKDGFKVKMTDPESFLEGKTVASFDMVLLCTFAPVEEEEFEMQQEFLDHYLSAPVAAIFTTCGTQPVP